jgi:WD40 repeat protein
LEFSHPGADSCRSGIAWSQTDQIAFSDESGQYRIISGQDGSIIHSWKDPSQHSAPGMSLAWSPDGTMLAAYLDSSEDIVLWNGEDDIILPMKELGDFDSSVLAWSWDGDYLALSGQEWNEPHIALIDVRNPSRVGRLKTDAHVIDDLVWLKNQHGLLSLESRGGQLILWDIQTETAVQSLYSTDSPLHLAWFPEGDALAAAYQNTVSIWDATSYEERLTFEVFPDEYRIDGMIYDLALSPGGDRFAVMHGKEFERLITIWDAQTGQQQGNLSQTGWAGLAWSPDGSRIVTRLSSYPDDPIAILDSLSREIVQEFEFTENEFSLTLDWSPNGETIAASGPNARIFDLGNNQDLTLNACGQDVRIVAWSPDGSQLASISSDGTIYVCDSTTYHLLYQLRDETVYSEAQSGYGGYATGLAWSPDGQFLAGSIIYASQPQNPPITENRVLLWDVASQHPIRIISWQWEDWGYYYGTHRNLAFSPDGTLLAFGHHDGTIWLVDTGE